MELTEDANGEQYWRPTDPIGISLPAAPGDATEPTGFLRLLQLQVSDVAETRAHLRKLRENRSSIWELFFPPSFDAAAQNLQLRDCAARITMISPSLPFTAV